MQLETLAAVIRRTTQSKYGNHAAQTPRRKLAQIFDCDDGEPV